MKVEVDNNWKWRNLELKFEVKAIVADEIWRWWKFEAEESWNPKNLKIIKFEVELWSLNLKAEEIMVEERWSW